jgi:hypothetical protein
MKGNYTMKKTNILKAFLLLSLVFCLVGCSSNDEEQPAPTGTGTTPVVTEAVTDTTVEVTTITPTVTEGPQEVIDFTQEYLESVISETFVNKKATNFNADDAEEKIKATELTSVLSADWKDTTFYVFDSNELARKAYDYIKTDLLVADTIVEQNDSLYGQDKTAVDIVIKKFYYLVNNLIICTTDFIGDPGVADATESEFKLEEINSKHADIMKFWNQKAVK